jgi:HB1, ASXL, restriction endonuclease HTH domain
VDYIDAAVRVLEEQDEALHWTVIQDIALQRGYLDPFTQKDIRKHLLAALSEEARRPEGRIVKADRGVYALRG